MKSFIKLILFFSFVLSSGNTILAVDNLPHFKYKNISAGTKLLYDEENDVWVTKFSKDAANYIVKTDVTQKAYYYMDKNGNALFKTDCNYEFLYNGKLISYDNNKLCFYSYRYANGIPQKIPLDINTIQEIFSDYKIIKISDFSDKTNVFKVKKHLSDLKILLYNDTDKYFGDYTFTSGNAEIETYKLKGFLTVKKSGMVHFSPASKLYNNSDWYVLLVR